MRMIRTFGACSAILFVSSPLPALASTTVGYGFVTQLSASVAGAVVFSVTSTDVHRSGIPACGAANPNVWAIDSSTAAGQAAIQVLMNAYARHKAIAVSGTGSCTIRNDVEAVDFFSVSDS